MHPIGSRTVQRPLVSTLCYVETAARSEKEMTGRCESCQFCWACGVDRYHRSAMLSTLNNSISHHFRRPLTRWKPCLPVANGFIENKNSQNHPEASLLVPTELGKGVGSLLEQDSKPNCQVLLFTSLCKCTLLAAGWCRGLWFQSTFDPSSVGITVRGYCHMPMNSIWICSNL